MPISLAGAFVGFLVGRTGLDGGSLMAPLLILLFGFSPAIVAGSLVAGPINENLVRYALAVMLVITAV